MTIPTRLPIMITCAFMSAAPAWAQFTDSEKTATNAPEPATTTGCDALARDPSASSSEPALRVPKPNPMAIDPNGGPPGHYAPQGADCPPGSRSTQAPPADATAPASKGPAFDVRSRSTVTADSVAKGEAASAGAPGVEPPK